LPEDAHVLIPALQVRVGHGREGETKVLKVSPALDVYVRRNGDD
jgi:hypothetical protein